MSTWSKLDPRLAMILDLPAESLREANEEHLERADAASEVHLGGRPERTSHPAIYSSLLYEHLRFDGGKSDGSPDPWISVLIKLVGNAAQARPRLEARGLEVRSTSCDILTALGRKSAIEKLWSEDEDVRFIELGRLAEGQTDRSVREIGAVAAREARPAITGKGVVIGVIDMDGLDFYHPDFRREDRSSRITHIWDQRLERRDNERSPEPWRYGVEYTATDISKDFHDPSPYTVVRHEPIVPADAVNHATHTTGIAAGNGRGSRIRQTDAWGRYTGVAPDAEIIYVNTFASGTHGLADLGEICDAVAYIFDRAGEKPCVVNISLGDDLGPHDGTSLVEQFIDCKLKEEPGRAVVIAAGNSNETEQYSEAVVTAASPGTLWLAVDREVANSEAVQVWYRDDQLDLVIHAPDGTTVGRVSPGGKPESFTAFDVTMTVMSVLHDGRNGHGVIEILLEARNGHFIPKGTWSFTLIRSSGDLAGKVEPTLCRAWIDGNTEVLSPMLAMHWSSARSVTDRSTLTTPATCKRAITVGNYIVHDGRLSTTSGHGPTRDARTKPEIVAPGGNKIVAPAARVRRGTRDERGEYAQAVGSSQAAAHVSGVVALLFEKHGSARLDAEQTKEILMGTADTSGLDAVPDPHHGFGWGRVRVP